MTRDSRRGSASDQTVSQPSMTGSPVEPHGESTVQLPAEHQTNGMLIEAPATEESTRDGDGAETVVIGNLPVSESSATLKAPLRRATASNFPTIGSAIGHYELIRELGRGGMGVVFLARDTRLGRLVAIKLLTECSGDRAARFLAEARATARCRHENIVVIYEVDEYRGYPYMVLEYIKGPTLRKWMEQRTLPSGHRYGAGPGALPVSPSLAVELMVPVVRALICAHESGIVHRDLKPANILLDDSGTVKVLDFGIAKQLSGEIVSAVASDCDPLGSNIELTGCGVRVGSMPFMSPEQWGAGEVEPCSDLWAVGIMLYWLVAGVHPLAPLSKARFKQIADLDIPMPQMSAIRPDVGPLGSIVDRCLRKRKAERIGSARALLAELEPLLPIRAAAELADGQSPFPGLAAFQESDAGRFYGRDRDISSVVARLRNHSLVTVTGPSGAGKSSFVRAGVIPALKRSGVPWRAFILRPGRRPLAALANVVTDLASTSELDPRASDVPALLETMQLRPGYLGATLRTRSRMQGHRILLFVDQFEELYTVGADPGERAAFVACLEGVADDASSPLRVVLALRPEYLDRLADQRQLLTEVTRGLFFLPPMRQDELRNTLTRPVEAAGYRFESADMVDTMLGAIGTTRSPLPLLQFTAARLWEARNREQRLLTRKSYDDFGGVAGALSTHADAVLAGLTPRDQRLARAVLLRLVTPERTRAIVSMDELRDLAGESDTGNSNSEDCSAIDQVIRRLAGARIVLIETSAEKSSSTVELIHESLIERWPRFAVWLDQDEEEAQFLARLRGAARQWEAGGQAEGLLWRDRAAREAQRWLEQWRGERRMKPRPRLRSARPDQRLASRAGTNGPLDLGAGDRDVLGGREERYLLAVVALAERARRQRWRLAIASIVSLIAVALVLSYLAIRADREAERADQEAIRVRIQKIEIEREAVRARNATRMATAREEQADPTAVLALLREIEPPGQPRGWSALARWSLSQGVARVVISQPEVVRWAAFSPDGKRIVTSSYDRIVRVWNADGSGQPTRLRGHLERVFTAGFSPDGRRIVTASYDRTARVWNADGSGRSAVFRGHEEWVKSAAFSPDGTQIVTASWDKTARVWNADGSGEVVVLRGHQGGLNGAGFSPDGKRIVTASHDTTARIWSADGSGPPVVLRGHQSSIYTAVFSPDGLRIVTASADKTARIWNADGSGQPVVLSGHQSIVNSAAFSPDGKHIVTTSRDKTVRVWSADGTGRPWALRGHQHYVYSAEFDGAGMGIVTASADKTARVWPAQRQGRLRILRGHQRRVSSARFSPDGKRIVTASWDRTARVWNADGTGEPVVLRGHQDLVYSAAFSPDGSHIVTASFDRTARIWNADGTGQPVVLNGHDGRVFSAAFRPDGERIVTASADRILRVWGRNGDDWDQLVIVRGHDDRILSAAFSPDGTRIVTASFDKTARIWKADGTGQPVVLRGHDAGLHSAAFSPDGERIVTASWDNTARVWNADGSGQPLVLRGHEDNLYSASFSRDGTRIVTSSADHTARVWNADGSGQPLVLRGSEYEVSWAAFSPDGKRIVTATDHMDAWVWTDIEPFSGPDDPRLWTATAYCMPVERRVRLLDVTEEMALANRRACLRRVQHALSR
ncbi:MAG: protein kinase [Proteobacteria bacterium]|nr:protein kinase [Pseudomonadota bacterium]